MDEQNIREGVPLNEFWEKDDGERMDGLIRIERFIKSQGTKSAQIWWAWYDIKKKLATAPAVPTDAQFAKMAEAINFVASDIEGHIRGDSSYPMTMKWTGPELETIYTKTMTAPGT